MKCPHCGLDIIKPSYKFCPSCHEPVNNVQTESHETQTKSFGNDDNDIWRSSGATFGQAEAESTKFFRNPFRRRPKNEVPDENDIKVVKNKIVWSLSAGEIARRINIDEFENFSNVKGVYIQEGVKALLIVDGDKVLEFTSGLYYLAGRIERSVSLVRRIFDFFRGRREGESEHDRDMRRNRLDIALQSLKGNSVVEVILISDGYVPVVLNTVDKNGTRVFAPYIIPTRISNLEMGVSLNMQITDYLQFATNYLGRSRTFRIADLQDLIKDIVGNELKRIFANTDIQSTVIPADMESMAKNSIKNSVNMNLFGMEVMHVVDVTMNNEDFMRFRELEHKLYCSQNELEYLIRTNTFRNRLQDEKNAQIIREAKSEEELRYALQQVNKDSLLHDDEFAAFVDLLESQRRLREATTAEEEHEAMLRIQKNRLVADDDFEVLRNEMYHRQINRDEVDQILLIQSEGRIDAERIDRDSMLDIRRIRREQEKEGAQHEADSQKQQHEFETESRGWGQDEKRLGHNIHMDDVKGEYQSRVDDRDIERKGKYSDFAHGERVRDWEQGKKEQRDTIDTDDYATGKKLDRAKQAQDLAMSGMERMREMNMREEELRHKQEMEKGAQELLGKEKEYQHEERQKALDATILEAKGKLSAEQLTAEKLQDMDRDAQIEFAKTLSSFKEMELLQKSTDEKIAIYEKLADMSRQYAESNTKDQKDLMEKMMRMMQDAMHTNADVAKTAVDGHNANLNAQFDAMGKMYAHRINEVTSDKEEYREESHSNRDYARHTADTAMHYTTEANRGHSAAEAMSGMASSEKVRMFIVQGMGTFSLENVLSMIGLGKIMPYTRVSVDGEEYAAGFHPDLRDKLLEKYGRKCPHCGKGIGFEGEGCPECGNTI
jgi:hypothetical protein